MKHDAQDGRQQPGLAPLVVARHASVSGVVVSQDAQRHVAVHARLRLEDDVQVLPSPIRCALDAPDQVVVELAQAVPHMLGRQLLQRAEVQFGDPRSVHGPQKVHRHLLLAVEQLMGLIMLGMLPEV